MPQPTSLRIDSSSTTPVYRQIVDGLRLLLVGGQIKPGEALPTVRTLALDLGVHFSTVAEAYRALSSEGWVQLQRRNGAIVTERHNPEPAPAAHADFARNLRQLIAQVRAEGLSIPTINQELEQISQELSR